MYFGANEVVIAVKQIDEEYSIFEVESRTECDISSQPFSTVPSDSTIIKTNRTSPGEDIPASVLYAVSSYNREGDLCPSGEALFRLNKSGTEII